MDRESAERHQAFPEDRLAEIRRQAGQTTPTAPPARAQQAAPSASSETGYYGLPLLKPPQWKWEVPAYFFTGGAAGAAAVIAGTGELCGADHALVRDARWVAAVCGAISPALLIADLGRPSRFLNMLRVFKVRSPMSVGSWTLVLFSSTAAVALLADIADRGRNLPLRMARAGSQVMATAAGLPLATYTGVLLGATAIPVWSSHVTELPIHFGASGLGAAVSLLELKGHLADCALNRLGIGSAIAETAIAVHSTKRRDPAVGAIKSGRAGWMSLAGGLLSGPLPLILRLLGGNSGTRRSRNFRRVAAASTIAGSVLTRYAWVDAGRASALDPMLPLELDPPASKSSETD